MIKFRALSAEGKSAGKKRFTSPKYSFKHLLGIYFVLLMLIIICSLTAVLVYAIHSGLKQMQAANTAVVNVYLSELQKEMEDLTAFSQELYADNYSFETLARERYQSGRKPEYEFELRNMVNNAMPYYGAILIFDQKGDISIAGFGAGYGPEETMACNELKDRIKKYWRDSDSSRLFQWQAYVDQDHTFLMNAYRLEELYLCSLIDLDRFVLQSRAAEDSGLFQVLFYSKTEELPGNVRLERLGISREALNGQRERLFPLRGSYLVNTEVVDQTSLRICCVMPVQYLWSLSRFSLLVILGVGILVLALIVVIVFSFRKIMVYPLDRLASATELLEQKSQAGQLPVYTGKSKIEELQKINEAIKRLVEQKVSLEQENLTRQQEKQHAELQYYQLQTQPHFYVNCLKSLYNMLENQEYGRMQRMILAFSNHLRYIFHNTLSLVTLREELEEVNHYYNIVLLDRSKPIILTQKVEESLLEEKVPPLLIQTFLENAVKYNGRNDEILRFLIQIDAVTWEEKSYMRIRLSDNGVGYSKEVLEKINSQQEPYGRQHVGITNLKKRLALIYQSDYQIIFYNEAKGGACVFLCLPLDRKVPAEESIL